jgi:hypothetical protein
MTPQEMADLVHLRRARDLMDRADAEPLDVSAMARTVDAATSERKRDHEDNDMQTVGWTL